MSREARVASWHMDLEAEDGRKGLWLWYSCAVIVGVQLDS